MKNKMLFLIFSLSMLMVGLNTYAQEVDDYSELVLSKKFNGQSIETTKKFTVGNQYSLFKFELRGMVETGKIIITFIKPDGIEFKSIEIDATSDVNFEQTLGSKSKNSDINGDWQIKVKAENAKGSYRLMLYTSKN